jgi:hypothetical protein
MKPQKECTSPGKCRKKEGKRFKKLTEGMEPARYKTNEEPSNIPTAIWDDQQDSDRCEYPRTTPNRLATHEIQNSAA